MKKTEVALELLAIILACWFLGEAVSSGFITPARDRCRALATRIADAREKQRLARELRDLVPRCESRLEEKLAILAEAQGRLLPDAASRLWVVELQQRLWSKFRDLQITPQQDSPAYPVSIRPVAMEGELPELAPFTRLVGREVVPPPAPLEARGFTLRARFRLTGPYASVLACLQELENQPMFLEITRLEARYERSDVARGDRMTAIVVVSSMVLHDPDPPQR